MKRVAAIVACSVLLGGCESLQSLQLPGFGGGAPTPITLSFESEPAGAEVTLASGASCRTPCALPVTPTADVTATFALPKYKSVTLTAHVVPAEKNPIGMEKAPAHFEPSLLHAELPPVPVTHKRRPTSKRTARSAPKPPSTAPSTPPVSNKPAPATPAAPGSVPSTAPPPPPGVMPAQPWPETR